MVENKILVRVAVSLLLVFFCFSSLAYAVTVVFKSGKTIEGEIIEKTDEYIKLEFQGVPLTYYFDDIESIDGKLLGNSKTDIIPRKVEKRYYPSGELHIEASMKDGKPDGIVKVYHENGNLKTESFCNGGKTEGMLKEYYESGNLKGELFYKNGEQEGITKLYYESGSLKAETLYKDGKEEGMLKEYYESGSLRWEAFFKDGKEEWAKGYDEKGNLIESNRREH